MRNKLMKEIDVRNKIPKFSLKSTYLNDYLPLIKKRLSSREQFVEHYMEYFLKQSYKKEDILPQLERWEKEFSELSQGRKANSKDGRED